MLFFPSSKVKIIGLFPNDTSYIGGNIDKDGYQRTSEAFINDLEFYYQNNYRMIRMSITMISYIITMIY